MKRINQTISNSRFLTLLCAETLERFDYNMTIYKYYPAPYKNKIRALKNLKRWKNNPNSFYNQLFTKHKYYINHVKNFKEEF